MTKAERKAKTVDEAYRSGVETHEGELEVDDDAKVSISPDGGAYVQAWVWVTDDEVGIMRCAQCKRMEIKPSNADLWVVDVDDDLICPKCFKKESKGKKDAISNRP